MGKKTMTKKLVLDVERMKMELRRFGKDNNWLAAKLGVSRQAVSYYYVKRPVRMANTIAPVFNLNPIDLVTHEEIAA